MQVLRYVARSLVFAGCVASSALAAPDDDYRRGLQAYQRGDVVTAMAALKPPAAAGHAQAQTLLAFILERADFADEAAKLYQAAAAQDVAQAHAALADLYLTGRGVAKDEKLGLAHFSKAAALGDEAAALALERAHRQGLHGLTVDAGQAAQWRARADELRRSASAPAGGAVAQ